jgi:hypothetical protein
MILPNLPPSQQMGALELLGYNFCLELRVRGSYEGNEIESDDAYHGFEFFHRLLQHLIDARWESVHQMPFEDRLSSLQAHAEEAGFNKEFDAAVASVKKRFNL